MKKNFIILFFIAFIPIKAFALIGIKTIKHKIKNLIFITLFYPSNISLASKFNCNSFHLSYPDVGTLKG